MTSSSGRRTCRRPGIIRSEGSHTAQVPASNHCQRTPTSHPRCNIPTAQRLFAFPDGDSAAARGAGGQGCGRVWARESCRRAPYLCRRSDNGGIFSSVRPVPHLFNNDKLGAAWVKLWRKIPWFGVAMLRKNPETRSVSGFDTPRQIQTLSLLSQGKTYGLIARELHDDGQY